MPRQHETSSVGIVGAGPGGLAAALLLAASGFRVRVYESQPTIGGRTARIRSGPYSFDKGPTFFMMPYVLDEVFAAAGKRLADVVDLKRLDPMYRLLIGRSGRDTLRLDATQDVQEMSRRLAAVSPRDGAAFARFLSDNRYKLRHSESILRNPMRSPLDLFAPATWKDTLKVGPVLAPHLSVHQLLCKYFEDEHVRLAVSFQSKYLGMSPFECPSLFTILPFIEYEYGIWHPIGGCNALMAALADAAMELGVEILTNTPVRAITFKGRRATGVATDAGEHAHDHVVVNADATWAIKHLVPPREREIAGSEYADASIDAKRYSCSTAMLYLGVKGEVDLPHHTIYVSETYEENLRDICERGVLSPDPSVYLCNPSRIDPTLAPKGCSSLYLLMPTPNVRESRGKVDWTKDADAARRAMLDQVARRMGLRDLESRIQTEVRINPADWQAHNINFGATFNLAHNLGQMLHKRPQNRLKGFDGLYLVGGGTHPGSGLPTIFLSAQISSRLICEEAGRPFAGNASGPRAIAASRALREPSPGAIETKPSELVRS